jgi:acyl dehydratase
MALADQVGLTGPDYEVDIERGKIREFARAMAAPLPEFVTGRTPIVPATFLVSVPYTWGYTLERPRGTVFANVEHDLTVSLHAEESFVFHGPPPRAGDRLTAHASLESVKQKQGASGGKLTFLTVLTEYRGEDGAVKAEQRSVSVTTSQAPGSSGWDVKLPDYQPDYSELERSSPFAGMARAEWAMLVEDQGPGPIGAGPLLQHDIVRFQGVVGEDDPLHYDTVWALKQDYPSTFGLGMYQASLMASYAAHWLPPETVRAYKIRFRDLTWPGDELVYAGTVLSKDESMRRADVHLTCMRKSGRLVTEAWMTCDFSDCQGN